MVTTSKFVWPLLMAVLMLLVVTGSARRLEGDKPPVGLATSSGDHPIIQFLKHLYLQQLSGPDHSCKTWDPNNPACPPRSISSYSVCSYFFGISYSDSAAAIVLALNPYLRLRHFWKREEITKEKGGKGQNCDRIAATY
ncbi:hypothetical protein EJB05_19953, partial [Eragrostis curvula]